MDTKLLNEVIACLPSGKTHFRYFQGAYAPKLLGMLMPDRVSVADLKRSPYARFLHSPLLKTLLARSGNGELQQQQIGSLWQEPSLPFLLSVSRWDGRKDRAWQQVSRKGENLVLQLNLPMEHERQFKKWLAPKDEFTFNCGSDHPVQQKDSSALFRETLAWSRIDIDFANDEALIEEIQSDGVRKMRYWSKRFSRCACRGCQQRLRYMTWFEPYAKLWSEAMLMATIEFVRNELGIRHVYLHTARSGWQVKNMHKSWQPPMSLYSDLPKKFAFKQTWGAPQFLLQERSYQKLLRQQPDIDFHYLSFADSLIH